MDKRTLETLLGRSLDDPGHSREFDLRRARGEQPAALPQERARLARRDSRRKPKSPKKEM